MRLSVHAKAVALCIAICKESPLKHFVGRQADAVNEIHRVEGGLFYVGEEVVGIAV